MHPLVVFSACRYSVRGTPLTPDSMNLKHIPYSFVLPIFLWTTSAFGQISAAPAQGTAVSYASVTQLNGLLAQLEATSKAAQADLPKLRIERWKTDASSKKQTLGNVDSVQRNLQNALPEIIGQLRNAPEDLPTTFKLYRNLDALYDVMGSVVEMTGAFGSKDDFQALSNDLSNFEGSRKQLAERLANLASSKEQEIVRLTYGPEDGAGGDSGRASEEDCGG